MAKLSNLLNAGLRVVSKNSALGIVTAKAANPLLAKLANELNV
ncbi:hypothetical protein [Aurantiacibacter rhizosphaerae]|nr:hypothetical protein [Aurantiacibacter rhizosphaerae]